MKALNPSLPPVHELASRFQKAKPFRHICIDDFLDEGLALGLLSQFPRFDEERSKNEFGHIGGKATQERVRSLGDAYCIADDLVKSPAFLDYLSTLTGIPNLEYDPTYFGGGTHENRHGQELDPHVDFNRDDSGKYRRLNMLIYLNHDWQLDWGGEIEIHSNPRLPYENQITSFAPIFNRCVMFETHETSWHGFPIINLPQEKQHLSRKSFSVYFYSRHAPDCGETPQHATFYVQRWLPKEIKPGALLSREQYQTLAALLTKRDHWIEYYQMKEIAWSRERESYTGRIRDLEQSSGPTLLGYAKWNQAPQGIYSDAWCRDTVQLSLKILRPAREIVIRGFIPEGSLTSNTVEISVGSSGPTTTHGLASGQISDLTLHGDWRSDEVLIITMKALQSFVPAECGLGADTRSIAWMFVDMTVEHR